MRPVTSSPAQHSGASVTRSMNLVLLALAPGILVATWFFGYGFAINIALSSLLACATEALVFQLKGKHWSLGLTDRSALVTAFLFALALPPGMSWLLLLQGILVAMLLGKHAFGGLGQNPFNPAMVGYLFLLLCYPVELTSWLAPASDSVLGLSSLRDSLAATSAVPGSEKLLALSDGMAAATPLLEYKLAAPNALARAMEDGLGIWSRDSDTGWELVNLAYLIGGLLLVCARVISWRIPFAILGGLILLSLLFYSESAKAVVGTPYFHLFGGATMLGAFFIATDPSSSAITPGGRLAYGLLIALLIYAVRVWGSYLDAVAIAVLMANFLAPLLDRLFAPRLFGRTSSEIDTGEAE